METKLSLAEEAKLADTLYGQTRDNPDGMQGVLLTGFTGFLGGEIVKFLHHLPSLHLYCLVRHKGEKGAMGRFQLRCLELAIRPERLTLIEGDLDTLPSIPPTIAERIDTIVHCAATVNLFSPYSQLRIPNVLGVRAILQFAASGRPKAIHAFSTTGVFLSPHYRSQRIFEVDQVLGQEGLQNGYAQSKWVADTMLARARHRGFNVTVYRPSFVGWHSQNGRYGEHDLVALLLLSSLQAGCAPQLDLQINSTPVDHLARTSCALLSNQKAWGGTYHLVHQTALSFRDLARMANLPLVDFPTWIDALVRRESRYLRFARMVHATQQEESSGSVELQLVHNREYDDRQVRKLLGPSYCEPHPLDADAIARFKGHRPSRSATHLSRELEASYPAVHGCGIPPGPVRTCP